MYTYNSKQTINDNELNKIHFQQFFWDLVWKKVYINYFFPNLQLKGFMV